MKREPNETVMRRLIRHVEAVGPQQAGEAINAMLQREGASTYSTAEDLASFLLMMA